jgi:tRNA threonylcarbamoyladenosine biosynthesis protein TsaB
MPLLAIDTSTMTASVCVTADDVTIERTARVTTHSEMLLPLVAEVLGEAKLAARDLDGIVCGAGPGSFTGLRIGLATAKGLCVALNKPLVLASSLGALALEAERDPAVKSGARVIALLDAKRREVYAGLYDLASGLPVPMIPEVVLSPGDVAGWARSAAGSAELLVVGDGALAYAEAATAGRVVQDAHGTPRAAKLVRLGRARLERGDHDDPRVAEPAYVRPPEVS